MGLGLRAGQYALPAAGGTLAFLLFMGYRNDFSFKQLAHSWSETLANLREGTQGEANPSIEELQKVLGPAPPPQYVTVMVALEEVLVKREWDVRGADFIA